MLPFETCHVQAVIYGAKILILMQITTIKNKVISHIELLSMVQRY